MAGLVCGTTQVRPGGEMGLSQLGHELKRLREARAQISVGETLDGGSAPGREQS